MFDPLKIKRDQHDPCHRDDGTCSRLDDEPVFRIGQRVRSLNKGRKRKGRVVGIFGSLYEVKWDNDSVTSYCGENSIAGLKHIKLTANAGPGWWEQAVERRYGNLIGWKRTTHMEDIEDLLNDAKGG